MFYRGLTVAQESLSAPARIALANARYSAFGVPQATAESAEVFISVPGNTFGVLGLASGGGE